MILLVDSGIDEISEDLFQIIVFENKTNKTICHVFGKTPEECKKNADDLTYAYNVAELLNI